MVFNRYKRKGDFAGEFLFCLPVRSNNKVDEFMIKYDLDWESGTGLTWKNYQRKSRKSFLQKKTNFSPKNLEI